MVCQCISPDKLCDPVILGQNLHLLLNKNNIPHRNHHIRSRIRSLRRCPEFPSLHRRTCYRRNWLSRYLLGHYDHNCTNCATSETTHLRRSHGLHIWVLVYHRTSPRWSIHRQRELALVLLYQSSNRGIYPGCPVLFPVDPPHTKTRDLAAADPTFRPTRHHFVSAFCHHLPARTAMGRYDLPLEERPHHCTIRYRYRFNGRIYCRASMAEERRNRSTSHLQSA